MAKDLRDWDVMMAEFHRRTEGVKRHSVVVKRGKNMMTPEVLGVFKDTDGEYVEVSTGTGMYGERLFGLTYADYSDGQSRLANDFDDPTGAVDAPLPAPGDERGRPAPAPESGRSSTTRNEFRRIATWGTVVP